MFRLRARTKRRGRTDSPRRVLIKQVAIGVALILSIALLLYGTWQLTRLPLFTIDTVEVLGGSTISHQTIKEKVEAELEGEYWHLIPKRFTWLYPRTAIESSVRAHQRIKNVAVERKEQTIHVVFEEYEPAALWCQELSSADCLFIDRSGYAFAPAPYLEGAAFIRYSDTSEAPAVGTSVFSGDYVEATNSFIATAYDQLGLNIIHVERVALDELVYHVSGGGEIKVTTRQSVSETLENLETILTAPDFEHLEPGNFKYIDLRYGNKIFVNEGKEETATSTEGGAVGEFDS